MPLGREWQLVGGIKKLVADMREQVKGVLSHREKCCMVLSAAMAASVAMEQVLRSCMKALQRLCGACPPSDIPEACIQCVPGRPVGLWRAPPSV